MELDIKLICARTELVIGEDTPIFISVTNTSAKSLTIPDIDNDPDWPKLRVRDVLQGTDRTFGPHDLENAHQHEFLPPAQSVTTNLAKGEMVRRDDRLLRFVEFGKAGTYEITALMPSGASAPIKVDVLPLKLHGAILSGPDGSNMPVRNCIWVHQGSDGAVVFLSIVNIEQHAVRVDYSERITELAEFVTPIPSISPRARLYPAHWLAYLSSKGLGGLYFLQQSPGPAAIARVIDPGQLLSPGLLDWTGATRDKPARVQVAVWHASPDQPRLGFYLFEQDGSIAVGAPVMVLPGELRFSGAVMMNDGEGRWVLVLQRNDQTHLDIFGHFRVGTVPVSPYSFAIARGAPIGARILLSREETLLGAVAVSDAVGTIVIPWQMPRNAAASLAPQIVLDAGGARIVRVHLALNESGVMLILGQTADGRWLFGGNNGRMSPLLPDVQALGEPIAAELSPAGIPFAVMAASETGIRYVSLTRGH